MSQSDVAGRKKCVRRFIPPRSGGTDSSTRRCYRKTAESSCGVPYPQFELQLAQQALEPTRVPAGFHAHPHLQTLLLKLPVELLGFFAVHQPPFSHLTALAVDKRNLLETRMIIAAYNQHVGLLSSEPFGGLRFQSLLGPGSRRCYGIITTHQYPTLLHRTWNFFPAIRSCSHPFTVFVPFCHPHLKCPAIHQSSLALPHTRASEAPLEKPAADCRAMIVPSWPGTATLICSAPTTRFANLYRNNQSAAITAPFLSSGRRINPFS